MNTIQPQPDGSNAKSPVSPKEIYRIECQSTCDRSKITVLKALILKAYHDEQSDV